ncbi:outer membrane protein OmpA/peptidoglycan-associated (lipo)protein [Desulfuromonas soudanensis]|uniref:Outer membrane protein OmpA/peptidoglycan-associated (Lipo)protein n=1 Tax=Desulfuromonas soudanensis TaxID=1603606 RepID=A0A0M5IZ55_9BACT|nr:OmpA family protein [Desulfuromonas soudanensis]ALC16681.1 outer membrane protein OmpA/peptidoglycan-associated (lipo)protein [Desulfuromonas soudanensis]
MHRGFSIIYLFILLTGSASGALATPTPYGETGLLTQPTAETLSAGNICVGIWANHAEFSDQGATIVPTAITLGLGTFLEAYGSYPNLLANGEESESGRGFANLGLKMKVWGGRSAPFKLAIDGQLRKSVSDNPALDGINSLSTRLIASFKSRRFGIHANGGYVTNENPPILAGGYNDQYVFGGGIELYPSERFRVIAEMESQSKLIDSMEGRQEAMLGVQYFVSPHLTFNLGAGIGLSDASPDYRGLVGFSTCQGIGTYQKPIPTIVPVDEEAVADEDKEPVKVIKVRTLTPLAIRTAPKPVEPVGQFEIPVESPAEEVVLPLEERLLVPGTNRLLAAPIVPIQPLMAVAPIDAVPEESAAIAADTPEGIVEPAQEPAPAVETLPVAEVVPGVVASESPAISSSVAAATSLVKIASAAIETAAVAAAPVVSAPVAVVAAPGAAVNTPNLAPAPVIAAPAAVVEPVVSPAPLVEETSAAPEPMAGAAAEPMAAVPPVAVDLPVPTADPVVETQSAPEIQIASSPLPATAPAAGIEPPPTELAAVPSPAPALSIPERTEVSGVPFEAISATAPAPGLGMPTAAEPPEVGPGPTVQATPAVTEQSIEAVVYRKFRLQEVTFGTNQWKVSQEGMAALAMVAEQLRKEKKEFLLRVDGHTDSLGSDNYNDKLSLQRSITIATNMVVHNGFDPARLFVKGFGESKPIAPNDSAEGKAKNRRVEILVLLPKKVPVQ